MRLTLHTDYAYRMLIYLGCFPDEITSTRDISSVYNIPLNHLTKVTHTLSKAGYITSQRGRNGGIKLAKKPEDISLDEVFYTMRKQDALLPCMDKGCSLADKREYCLINDSCTLKGVLHQSLTAFIKVLGKFKLCDVITQKDRNAILQKRQLLNIRNKVSINSLSY